MTEDAPKVVIIDDDPRLLKAYQIKFQNDGLEIVTVDDSTQAHEIVKAESPDVVVLDVLMPVKNGWDVLKELKEDPLVNNIPVLLVSNIGSDEREAEALEAGATAYLLKSDTPIGELSDLVKKLAAEGRTPPAQSVPTADSEEA